MESNGDLAVDEEQLLPLLLYIKEHQYELQTMQAKELCRQFFDLFRARNDDLIDKAYEVAGVPMSLHSDIPEDYYDELLMQSLFTTISLWLEKDCLEDPEVIVKIMMRLTKL